MINYSLILMINSIYSYINILSKNDKLSKT